MDGKAIFIAACAVIIFFWLADRNDKKKVVRAAREAALGEKKVLPTLQAAKLGNDEILRVALAQIASQKTALSKLHAEDTQKATVIGEQGREIWCLTTQVREQETQIKKLQNAAVVASAPTEGNNSQFRRLRALIIKELHPDHAVAGSVDSALRTEVFKVLWPKIDQIMGE